MAQSQADRTATQSPQEEEFDVKLDSMEDAKLNPLVVAQLSKTKMCTKFAKGTCRDPNCGFAHGKSELRTPLDLSKTAMCRMFAKGKCSNNNCRFAHGEQELRTTTGVYKTQLCNFYNRGHCKKGNQCRHAHGERELRVKQPPASPIDSDDTQCPSDDSGETNGTQDRDSFWDMPAPENVPMPRTRQQLEAEMQEWWRAATATTVNPELEKLLQARRGLARTPQAAKKIRTPQDANNAGMRFISQETHEEMVPTFPVLKTRHPKNSEPMKIALSSAASSPVVEPLQHSSRGGNQFSTEPKQKRDELAWLIANAAQALECDQTAQNQFHRGRDPLTNSVGASSDQMAVAAQVVKAAELELLAAQMKWRLQIKQAAEMASSAVQLDESLACISAATDQQCGKSISDIIGNRPLPHHIQMQGNLLAPRPLRGF